MQERTSPAFILVFAPSADIKTTVVPSGAVSVTWNMLEWSDDLHKS